MNCINNLNFQNQSMKQASYMDIDKGLPMQISKEQTLQWHQSHYHGDSGIQSEMNTRAPSISGHTQMDDGIQHGHVQQPNNNYGMNMGGNIEQNFDWGPGIRAAMFPETMDEGVEITSTQFDVEEPMAVKRLSEPSQILKQGVGNLINYQVCALGHLTSRHPESENAQDAVRIHNGIPILVKPLNPPSSWPFIKAVIRVIRNLACCPSNHPTLRERGTLPKLAQICMQAQQNSSKKSLPNQAGQQQCKQPGKEEQNSPLIMDEIMEASVNAMDVLTLIRELKIIPISVKLLYSDIEDLQRVAAGVLCELAAQKEFVELIKQEGATTPLTDLLHSPNEDPRTRQPCYLGCPSINLKGPPGHAPMPPSLVHFGNQQHAGGQAMIMPMSYEQQAQHQGGQHHPGMQVMNNIHNGGS